MELLIDHTVRLQRALISLEGLSVADALGGFFEFTKSAVLERVCKTHQLPGGVWHWTDDTAMALSIVACLREHGTIDQDWLAQHFAAHYERSRGYGPATRAMLRRIRVGADWRIESTALFGGSGSFGNGGAMRVAPLGAYWADEWAILHEQARAATEITHVHPEAVAGALAVALAAAQTARDGASTSPTAWLQTIIEELPTSIVRDQLMVARDLPLHISVAEAVQAVGNGSQVSAQDTVPFALWCAAHHRNSYEAAIWQTLSGGGDCDTTCAIVGGIVVLATGAEAIPSAWRNAREPLPMI